MNVNKINAGSMADIAFLLLVFFLVTTQINQEKGIVTNLASGTSSEPKNESLTIDIWLNEHGKCLLDGVQVSNEEITTLISDKLMENQANQSILSITSAGNLPYESFIDVLDQSKSGIKHYHNQIANAKFGQSFDQLDVTTQKQIKEQYAVVFLESEKP